MVIWAEKTLSGADKWTEKLTCYRKEQLQNLFLKTLPFSILRQLEEAIEKKWEQWKTTRLSKNTENPNTFVLEISSEKSELRLKDIIAAAKKIDALPGIDFLFAKKSPSEERRKAHTDPSKGWMRDFDPDTLLKLAERIEETPKDAWRLLADSLGFDNRECHRFLSPHALINRWIQKYPSATVARLYFEAKELKMKRVCSFLDAIPLEGARKIVPQQIHFNNSRLTRFHLQRIEEIARERKIRIMWDVIAEKKCSLALSGNRQLSPFDSLWKDSRIDLTSFLRERKADPDLKAIVKQFEEEGSSGLFENKSSGGVTYDEIFYLANTSYKYCPIPVSGWGRFSWAPLDMHVIKKYIFKDFYFGHPLGFFEFLLHYWQDPEMGEKCNLDEFCLKIINILESAQDGYQQKACDSTFLKVFKETYLSIKPYRSYVKELEVEKLAAEVKEVANPVLESRGVEKREEKEECVICFDKKPEAVLIPCGHLNCCLQCIEHLSNCPTCRKEITQKIKIFKV